MSDLPKTGNIRVSVRLRPLNEREIEAGSECVWSCSEDSLVLSSQYGAFRGASSCAMSFDNVIGPKVLSNQRVYEVTLSDLVQSSLRGIHATVFAYGQTSAGKTFTMFGVEDNPGIICHGLSEVFQHVQDTPDREFSFRLSYMEIYNESIRDLLCPENDNLKIHESLTRGVFVGNLTEEPIQSAAEALLLVRRGEEWRRMGETNLNEKSSRSHTIVRLTIESREKSGSSSGSSNGEGSRESGAFPILSSMLTFVDLAGSEKARLTGAEGQRLKEGGHINKSLLTLTTVISKLADGDKSSHIPYRDSKLTRILQTSLAGNTNTAIICAVTPASHFLEETISTLKFASRAKTIAIAPRVNEIVPDQEIIRRLRLEVSELKARLSSSPHPSAEAETSCPAKKTRIGWSPTDIAKVLSSVRSLRSAVIGLQTSAKMAEESHFYSMAVLKSTIASRLKTFQATLKFQVAEFLAQAGAESLPAGQEKLETPADAGAAKTSPSSSAAVEDTLGRLKALELLANKVEHHVDERRKSQQRTWQAKVESLRNELDQRNYESDTLLAKIKAAQDDLMERTSGFQMVEEQLQQKVQSLQSTNAGLAGEVAQLHQQLGNSEYQVETERARSQLLDQQLASLTDLLEDQRKQNKVLKAEHDKLLVERTELCSSLQDSQSTARDLEKKVERLEALLDETKGGDRACTDATIVLRIELEKLREVHQKECRRLGLIIADLEEELDRLKS